VKNQTIHGLGSLPNAAFDVRHLASDILARIIMMMWGGKVTQLLAADLSKLRIAYPGVLGRIRSRRRERCRLGSWIGLRIIKKYRKGERVKWATNTG